MLTKPFLAEVSYRMHKKMPQCRDMKRAQTSEAPTDGGTPALDMAQVERLFEELTAPGWYGPVVDTREGRDQCRNLKIHLSDRTQALSE